MASMRLRLNDIKGKSFSPTGIYVTDAWNVDRTTSVPKSVFRYEVDKVRPLDLVTSLSQSCSPK